MNSTVLLAAAASGLIYGITPGPGVLAVFGIGANRGQRAATAFLAGHFVGDMVWSTLALISILGATELNPAIFGVVGTISGLYLTWLGWRTLTRTRSPFRRTDGNNSPAPLVHGLFFGFTNPKAYPVAAATMTALLSSEAASLSWGMLPALVLAASAGGLLAYSILLQIVGVRAFRNAYRHNETIVVRVSGVLFMGFGIHALSESIPTLLGDRRL